MAEEIINDLGFKHIRFKSGLELLSHVVEVEETVGTETLKFKYLFRPARLVVEHGDTGFEVMIVPLSLMSDEDCIPLDYSSIEFIINLNDAGTTRYLSFWENYEEIMSERTEVSTNNEDKPTRTLH